MEQGLGKELCNQVYYVFLYANAVGIAKMK